MRTIAVTSVNRFTLALALLALGVSAPVQAETLNCTTIMSLPATLSTQGLFCLTGNLATAQTTSNAIEITANNVTLDLNGFKLGGQAAGSATDAVGIFSSAANTTVKNGIVRGFRFGIDLRGRGAVVEDLLVDQNTFIAILMQGQGAIVRRNRVVDTGGSTIAPNVAALGISATGPGSLIASNLVSGLTGAGTGSELGIDLSGANSLAIDNSVTDTAKPTGGFSVGIRASSASPVNFNILGNTVSNMKKCIEYLGIATGLFAGNTVTDCDTNFTGGTAGQQGNNFIAVP